MNDNMCQSVGLIDKESQTERKPQRPHPISLLGTMEDRQGIKPLNGTWKTSLLFNL